MASSTTITRTKAKGSKRSPVRQTEESPAKVSKVEPNKIPESSKKPKVSELFDSLEYGPAPESPAVAQAWLEDHQRNFGHFINNQWVRPEGRKTYSSYNPATGELLANTVQGQYTARRSAFICVRGLPVGRVERFQVDRHLSTFYIIAECSCVHICIGVRMYVSKYVRMYTD